MSESLRQLGNAVNRRAFLSQAGTGIGAAALSSLLASDAAAGSPSTGTGVPHFAPRAKRVIYLFMSGGPSHVDLFDPKPLLTARDGEPIPAELIRNHQFAMIKSDQPKIKGSPYRFAAHGESGNVVSSLLPHLAEEADALAIVRSLHTNTFNHDPAVMFMNTGDVRFGRPAMGAWLSYGLGSENRDLPGFVVLASGVNTNQPLLEAYWGSGFLPTHHQGVQFRNQGQPVLYVKNPEGLDDRVRRDMIDVINEANRMHLADVGDPEIRTRIEQYEMAYRMQMSVPELTDLSTEAAATHELYGTQPGQVAFSNNCLLARRLIERGVRFVQLYHKGWDSHATLQNDHERQCRETDKPIAALLSDLRQRGLLEDTLIIWGGEFGRTPMAQGQGAGYGRDHHPHGFTMWLAGAGVRAGTTHGSTDEFGYFAVENKVHVHDLHATVLHILGIDHERLVYPLRGRDFRLTDVHGEVVEDLLA
ncbi:MAG: DUF1501 domain-containing protein [Planctomycetota bacterium]|nr:MAG: DUF1501 domain-containing protein [Planctomycetota bacterium]REJ93684.1 MAG: DUF1501 domain-containing protein [Planctomycetota bacterium]